MAWAEGIRRHCTAAFAFLCLFLILFGHSVAETARDGLFLASLPAHKLGWAYLGMMLAVLAASALDRRVWRRADKRRRMSASLLGCAAVMVALAQSTCTSAPFLYVFYTWTGTASSLLLVHFWLLVGALYDVRQARRMYTLIGLGAAAGAMAGAGGAAFALRYIEPPSLLYVSAAAWTAAALLPALMLAPSRLVPRRSEAPMPPVGAVWQAPYLRRLLLVSVLGALVLTLVDFLFKETVRARTPPAELASFFGRYYLVANGAALAIHLTAAPILLRRFAVTRVLTLLPALLFAGSLASLTLPAGLWMGAVLTTKAFDVGFRHPVDRAAFELLYMPLASDIRDRFKAVIDGAGRRMGQAVASLGILGATAVAVVPTWLYGVIIAALSAAWWLAVRSTRAPYAELFQRRVQGGQLDARTVLPEFDLASVEVLLTSLNSEDDRVVLGALDLLASYERMHLVPALILYHPSVPVVLGAFEHYRRAGADHHVTVAGRLLGHPNPEIRSAAVRAVGARSENLRRMMALARSDDIVVQVHAAACLRRAPGRLLSDEVRQGYTKMLHDWAAGEDREAKRLVYEAERAFDIPSGVLSAAEPPDDAELRIAWARAVARHPSPQHLRGLLPMLAHADERAVARDALEALGEGAVAPLWDALLDPDVSNAVKRHIPRTMSRIPSAAAAAYLLRMLSDGSLPGKVRFKALRGLGRMVDEFESLRPRPDRIRGLILTELSLLIPHLELRSVLDRAMARTPERFEGPGVALLRDLAAEKERNAINRLFRLMHLMAPDAEMSVLYAAYAGTSEGARADALELLSTRRPRALPGVVMPFLEAQGTEDRLALLRRASGVGSGGPEKALPSLEEALRQALLHRSHSLSMVAGYVVAELGLSALRPELVRRSSEGSLAEALGAALRRLDRGWAPVTP